ncbi:Hypothetical predicted protein [Podarcis lilfordi]|uniref:Uncharacterized protein n=1 Tax=Podarcis lilfordi TaxID=74358 RepID=A0AA35PHV9_9SAUR|nr:Hypothetical predicted protein [Podarcis lilfordi]
MLQHYALHVEPRHFLLKVKGVETVTKRGLTQAGCLPRNFRINSMLLVASYGSSSRDYPKLNLGRLCSFSSSSCSLQLK